MSDSNDEPKLRFLTRGNGLTPDYDAQARGIRRFHGWKHDPTKGPRFKDSITGEQKAHGGFEKQVRQIVEIPISNPHRNEYIRHLREGSLWPADSETAQLAGVPFDPTYGGEHDVDTPPAPAAAKAPVAPTHEAAHAAAAE